MCNNIQIRMFNIYILTYNIPLKMNTHNMVEKIDFCKSSYFTTYTVKYG